jgi:hypothetical protein
MFEYPVLFFISETADVNRFQLESLLQAVQNYKVTHLPIVPPIAAALAKVNISMLIAVVEYAIISSSNKTALSFLI